MLEQLVLHTESLAIGYSSKKDTSIISSDINIELKQGELVGLIGANGIGKSTLLRTLTKVQKPLSGTISLRDKHLEHYSNIDLSKVLSLVLTEHLASKNLTVFELVALGRQPYTNWIGSLSENDNSIVENAINAINLDELKHRKCFELSDGQLQKVMIARALAQDTDLIILDEPTTHLDMYHKAYILKLLKNLTESTNKTILFSSHEIDLALQLCDSIIVMLNDRTVQATPSDLISSGVLNELFPEDLILFDKNSGAFRVKK
ncbi:ATP-binding cassette domain-containing protein [Winogradskyella sp. 3972H.M.0a.05]|uniref:ABC transporter ATP-binding protein n=1 Tax=Winogradskyella sp. 3972H.M.0a.05 TaxID=2950277 RepID=UPI00339AC6F4